MIRQDTRTHDFSSFNTLSATDEIIRYSWFIQILKHEPNLENKIHVRSFFFLMHSGQIDYEQFRRNLYFHYPFLKRKQRYIISHLIKNKKNKNKRSRQITKERKFVVVTTLPTQVPRSIGFCRKLNILHFASIKIQLQASFTRVTVGNFVVFSSAAYPPIPVT